MSRPVYLSILIVGSWHPTLHKTTDGAQTWQALPTSPAPIQRLWIDDLNPGTIYAIGGGKLYNNSDGGASWVQIGQALPNSQAITVFTVFIIDPRNPQRMYLGMDGEGVFATGDGGQNWRPLNEGLLDKRVRALAVDPSNSSHIFAGTADLGVFDITIQQRSRRRP